MEMEKQKDRGKEGLNDREIEVRQVNRQSFAETRQVNCECSCRSDVTAKGIKEEIKLRIARA